MSTISNMLSYKQDPVFEAAKNLLSQFKEKLEYPERRVELKLPFAERILVFPYDKERSPGITCFGQDQRFVLIDFPKNSKPYTDKMSKNVKECIILEGNIYDANNPKFMKGTGDHFKVYPWENIAPYTKGTPALALVTLQK